MQKISESILSKVSAEAATIVQEAEDKARAEIAEAEKLREAKILEAKRKLIEAAEAEAARIISWATIQSRQEILAAKTSVINQILDEVKSTLQHSYGKKEQLLALVREALPGIGSQKARLFVSPKDLSVLRDAVQSDSDLSDKIVDIKEYECLGGVIVEDIQGKLRIDNTYDTRIEMVIRRLLPKIAGELFQEKH